MVAVRVRDEDALLSVKEERWIDTLDRFLRRKRVDFVREIDGWGGVVTEDWQREDGKWSSGVREEAGGGGQSLVE